ncbi:MAG: DUF6504 family protein [Planctomycetota bacterium]|jgi:hypothetical protein
MSDPLAREEFVGERIDVAEGSGVEGPLRFTWRGREYVTEELERVWQDRGQPSGLARPSWRTRRHRNYFEVRTASGERFRVYLDRGTKADAPRVWVLERRLLPSG